MSGFTKRQPMVVSWISAARWNGACAFAITNGARVIDSTPPAMAKRDLAGADGARGGADRIEARGAEPVDGGAGDGVGELGQERRHAGDVAVVLARLVGAAEDHLVELGPVGVRVAGDERAQGDGGEVVGADIGERAAEAADGRADGIADIGVAEGRGGGGRGRGHGRLSRGRIRSRRGRSLRPASRSMPPIISFTGRPRRASLQRALGRAVAMRAGAIDDEERIRRIGGEALGRERAVRDVDGARHVALGEELGRADVDEDEAGRAGAQGLCDVRAIGLEGEPLGEMGDGAGRWGGWRLGHGVGGHARLPSFSRAL